jgi:putative hydrolase of the HAD superfamily
VATLPARPRAVTFDCWSTLIVERAQGWGPARRARILAAHTGADEETLLPALGAAWREHQVLWHRGRAFTARDMTRHVLRAVGVELPESRFEELVTALEDEALRHDVVALPGARDTLRRLADAGVRRALVCDTGFSPGRVVRALLDRVGLLELLEVTAFSDEVGIPKPHPRPFRSVLDAVEVQPRDAVHVGDLRRSDVAGARALGMGSVRLALHHDDAADVVESRAGVIDCGVAGCSPVCPRPEADVVARDYSEVMAALGLA